MHLLTERSQRYRALQDAEYGDTRNVHYEVGSDGRLRVVGIPDRGFAPRLREKLHGRGIRVSGSVR
jgi:hypothetical protein